MNENTPVSSPGPGGRPARGSTPRTQRLAEAAAATRFNPFDEQAQRRAEAPVPPDASPLMRESHAFAYAHPRLTPVVRDDELIVGARQRADEHHPGYDCLPDVSHDPARAADAVAAERPDLAARIRRGLVYPGMPLCHKVVEYDGIVRTGCAELARRARQLAAERTGDEHEFSLAFAMGHEAMIAHAATYAEECRRQADAAPGARRAELLEMARCCDRVPALPATTFPEALQSFWFAYLVGGDGLGRLDQWLYEYYQRDLDAGRLTPSRAQELLECLLIKVHADTQEGNVNISSVLTLTLGGVRPDGSNGTTELTRLVLQAVRAVRLLRPTVYLRCSDDTPLELYTLAADMLGEGLAEPHLYGEAPIIEGLRRVGLPVEEARDFALSGCTEVVLPGRGNWGSPNGWLNLALLADDALHAAAALGVSDEAALWSCLASQAEALAGDCRDCQIAIDRHAGPYYLDSLLMPVCLERGRDMMHGGATSNLGQWDAIGLPNAADMLYAARVLAFERGIPLGDWLKRLEVDDPALRTACKGLPRFGNDQSEVDAMGARLLGLVSAALERRRTPLRQALTLGHLAGVESMHIAFGHLMGATLDGRRARQPLADSLAGSQGCTRNGPTATIRSVCALDHSRLIAGNTSTLRLTPADFVGPDNRANVAALFRTFVALGGSQLQINVTDTATLRQAQAEPEQHRGLLVRVAGYSADFTGLGKRLQDEIMTRQ